MLLVKIIILVLSTCKFTLICFFYQSPALCVYNNAVFEEDDWDGIASVYLSHKENIAYKIGRYGQGFKSVFHITGMLSITFCRCSYLIYMQCNWLINIFFVKSEI